MVLRWFFDVATIAFNGFRWFRTIGQTMRWFRWIVVVYPSHLKPTQGIQQENGGPQKRSIIEKSEHLRILEII